MGKRDEGDCGGDEAKGDEEEGQIATSPNLTEHKGGPQSRDHSWAQAHQWVPWIGSMRTSEDGG
mgnify:CR=1 FL=1